MDKSKTFTLVVLASILTAMVWPLEETTKIIEASPIKNWTSNENITYTDLNTNFNHLHANLGHGHGPIITANDIAANAGIRPEQTTFGSSINRALVFNGTFKDNPDAGVKYISVNGSGSLAVTLTEIPTSGFQIDAAAASGANPDGGSQVYTVFYKVVGLTAGDTGLICTDQGSGVSLSSPLHVAVDCFDLTDPTPPSNKVPNSVSVMVFSNKVQ